MPELSGMTIKETNPGGGDLFKTIKRYPDYEINLRGDVRKKGTTIIRKTYPVNGHPKIILNGKTEYISRLVAETYIPNPDNKSDVNHIDRDTENNDVSNLEWATHGEIQKESYKGFSAPGGREYSKKIMIVETGEEFPSIRACAKAVNGTPSGIRQCLNKKLGSYRGYHYKLLP